MIDGSFNNQDIKGTEQAQQVACLIKPENLSLADQARFQYYQANAWSNLRHFRRYQNQTAWDYDQEELTHEIYFLRSALNLDGFKELSDDLKCQIYTNLGNLFSHIGRFIEAQQTWRNALNINPQFAMALGNIGQGCFFYGRAVYDATHQNIFIYHAYQYLSRALLLKQYWKPGPITIGSQSRKPSLRTGLRNIYKLHMIEIMLILVKTNPCLIIASGA
ncbi:MAG: Uncharacterized protein JWP37_3747 [Mucilaginibacter sp.]|nr:Uncharacterized protein [Mucilaginibacter sp.]